MKTPTEYGSENEETSFIRRIAAPDRANRRQKKRVAAAGAAVGILAAAGVVGYTAFRTAANVPTQQLEAKAASFVTPLDDSYYPSFEQLDADLSGDVSQGEYLAYLGQKHDADQGTVQDARIPEEIKATLSTQLRSNFEGDAACFKRAMKRINRNKLKLTRKNLATLYYSLDEFCPTQAIVIPAEIIVPYVEPPKPEADPQTHISEPMQPEPQPINPEPQPINQPYQPEPHPVIPEPQQYHPEPVPEPRYQQPEPEPGVPNVPEPIPEPIPEPAYPDQPIPFVDVLFTEPSYPVLEPTYHEPEQPTYHETEQPTYHEPAQTHQEPTPTYQEPTPGYEEPTPGYEEPTPGYQEPTPGYEEPTPTYQEHTPSHQEPTPTYQEPTPGYEEPTPGYDEPTSGYEEPTINYEEPMPSYEEPTQGLEPPVAPWQEPVKQPDAPVEPESEQSWMTKEQFKEKLNNYFAKDLKHLEQEADRATAQAAALTAKIQNLDDCIEQAANKFGWYGVYEQEPHFQNAVEWVANVCLAA